MFASYGVNVGPLPLRSRVFPASLGGHADGGWISVCHATNPRPCETCNENAAVSFGMYRSFIDRYSIQRFNTWLLSGGLSGSETQVKAKKLWSYKRLPLQLHHLA